MVAREDQVRSSMDLTCAYGVRQAYNMETECTTVSHAALLLLLLLGSISDS